MKFLDQPRFAQARLANDHDQLAVALPCSLPAPHQHPYFVIAPNKRRKLALSGAASAAARTDEPVQNPLFWHALEGMRSTLFRHKSPATCRSTSAVTKTALGSANACTRAAMLATSP